MKTLVCLLAMTFLSVMCYAQRSDYNVNPWVAKHFHAVPGELPGADCLKPPYKVNEEVPVGFYLNPGTVPSGIDGIDPGYYRPVSKSKLINHDHVSPALVVIKGKITVWNPVGIDGMDPWYYRPVCQAKTVNHR